MSIFSRRGSIFSKRVDKIEGELSTISARLKSLSKDVEKQGDAAVERVGEYRRSQVVPPARVQSAQVPASKPAADVGTGPADLQRGRAAGQRAARLDERKTPHESQGVSARSVVGDDEQFANYFMSGGLKKEVVEPLRRERHIQRRRALFLMMCFLALVFALLYFKLWR
ncbi:MAG: hypothetical protein WCN95_08785 [bacterium]